jgi:hypothetical protein
MSKWFDRWWWQYLLMPLDPTERYIGWYHRRRKNLRSWLRAVRCRMRGHPCGPIYHNPGGLEPNNHCKHCGDEIA